MYDGFGFPRERKREEESVPEPVSARKRTKAFEETGPVLI
jgi:hypothetical protein